MLLLFTSSLACCRAGVRQHAQRRQQQRYFLCFVTEMLLLFTSSLACCRAGAGAGNGSILNGGSSSVMLYAL
jgi:hypothetical protein